MQWEPFGRHNAREGSRLAFGEYVDAQYAIEKADVILSLDADFLCAGTAGCDTRARSPRGGVSRATGRELNRLYAVESTPTNTGTKADHRLPLRASEIEAFARAVAAALGVAGAGSATPPEAAQRWMAPLVKDLQAARGRSLVIAGDGQPPAVHALAHAMNAALGNVGATVVYTQTAEARPINQRAALQELVGEMNAGTVSLLLILGGNPVYTAPAGSEVRRRACRRSRCARTSGLYHDETAALCHWHIPEAHFLEAWSDVRADDGTRHDRAAADRAALRRPVARTRVMSAFSEGGRALRATDLVRCALAPRRRRRQLPRAAPTAAPAAFDQRLAQVAARRRRADTAFAPKTVTLQASRRRRAPRRRQGAASLEVVFRPDPSVYDGRFANNAWLQELPKSLTKLTWDNAALIAPATAARLDAGQRRRASSCKQGERRSHHAFRSGSRPARRPTR